MRIKSFFVLALAFVFFIRSVAFAQVGLKVEFGKNLRLAASHPIQAEQTVTPNPVPLVTSGEVSKSGSLPPSRQMTLKSGSGTGQGGGAGIGSTVALIAIGAVVVFVAVGLTLFAVNYDDD